MALDHLLDLFAHLFLCLVLLLTVLVIPTCGRLSWLSGQLLSHNKIVLID